MASNGNKFYDVLVIGGGVIGMSIARELTRRGAGKVALIERGKLGQEASFAAAGMLTVQADAEKRDDFFDLCLSGRAVCDTFAAELREETGIDVQLETSGTITLAFNQKQLERANSIFDWQSRAGLPVEKLSASDVLELEPHVSPDILGGLFFPRDAQVDNRLLVAALAESNKRAGVEIVEGVEVQSLLTENGKITGVETPAGTFFGENVVLATGAWSSFIKVRSDSVVDVFPVRGQMLSFHPSEKMFRHVIMSQEGYIVPRADNKVLVGATIENVGFDKNLTGEGVDFLLKTASEISPGLKNREITEKWAGLRPCTADKMPILGKVNDVSNLFVATAHYRNGILLAQVTAQIAAEAILEGKASMFLDKFSVNRFVSVAAAQTK